jgi:hypothetical protein
MLIFAGVGFLGCGSGGRLIPPVGGSGYVTPSGTYSVVVSATAAGLTHNQTLTLVVQ